MKNLQQKIDLFMEYLDYKLDMQEKIYLKNRDYDPVKMYWETGIILGPSFYRDLNLMTYEEWKKKHL